MLARIKTRREGVTCQSSFTKRFVCQLFWFIGYSNQWLICCHQKRKKKKTPRTSVYFYYLWTNLMTSDNWCDNFPIVLSSESHHKNKSWNLIFDRNLVSYRWYQTWHGVHVTFYFDLNVSRERPGIQDVGLGQLDYIGNWKVSPDLGLLSELVRYKNMRMGYPS